MKPPWLFSEDEASATKLHLAVARLRDLLRLYFPICLVGSALFGLVVLIVGISVGASVHKSGFIVGGILTLACLALAVTIHDAWDATSLGLGMLDLDEHNSRDDILKFLKQYSAKRSAKVSPHNGDFDDVLVDTYAGLTSELYRQLAKAFVWGPTLLMVISICCCIGTSTVDGVPSELFAISLSVSILTGLAVKTGIVILCKLFLPVINDSLKATAEGHVDLENGGPPAGCSSTVMDTQVCMLRRKLGSTDEGQAIARESLNNAALRHEPGVLRKAVEKGWFAGLPLLELEGVMLKYLKAAIDTCYIKNVDIAIEESRAVGMPEASLEEAHQAKLRIAQALEKLQAGITQLDIRLLNAAIDACQAEGWPQSALQHAVLRKNEIDNKLSLLREAAACKKLATLEGAIESCKAFGLPACDLAEA